MLGEPGRSLPVSFNDSLTLILFGWCLSCVQHHSLHGRSLERSPFLFPYLSSDFCCLLAHLLIAIATKDVLQFQVTTFRTRVNIVLKEKKQKANKTYFNKKHKNAHQSDRNDVHTRTFLDCSCCIRSCTVSFNLTLIGKQRTNDFE